MPRVGDVAELSRQISDQDIERFAQMTGDRNPLHFDAAAATASVFGRIIVQGGVTSGLLNALVAEELPGPGSVFLSVEWKFIRAVGPGETITARAEVLSVREDKPICQLATTISNAAGGVCLSGCATTYTVPLRTGRGAS
jgi:acyl dehydratase